jgi:hypothetical protein
MLGAAAAAAPGARASAGARALHCTALAFERRHWVQQPRQARWPQGATRGCRDAATLGATTLGATTLGATTLGATEEEEEVVTEAATVLRACPCPLLSSPQMAQVHASVSSAVPGGSVPWPRAAALLALSCAACAPRAWPLPASALREGARDASSRPRMRLNAAAAEAAAAEAAAAEAAAAEVAAAPGRVAASLSGCLAGSGRRWCCGALPGVLAGGLRLP